jgi:hypothetical protein
MSLDIFEMTINTNGPTIVFINNEVLIFMHCQVDVKDVKCPLQWWEKHESMFPTIGFCIRQIFGIVRCQIEIKRIFSLPRIVIANNNIMSCDNSMDKNGE